jgi:UDP-3-O-acyl-N-acetylglucosamine deacetylase
MVEHIIALKGGLGLDNVVIKTNSGDPPLFDDSSLPLVKAVQQAKIIETNQTATYITVKEPLAFAGNRGDFLMFLPDDGSRKLRLDVAINWSTIIGDQRIVFDVTPDTFRYGAYARTNATHRQYQLAKTVGWLFADTRNLGYDKDNILIHGRKRWYGEPRFPLEGTDRFLEPVWHRATLDLLAALSLTGPDRFVGTVVSYRAGHTQDCDAVRHLYRHDLLKRMA